MRLSLVLSALLMPALLGAQTVTRWTLAWTDNSYRYVGNERVPVGPQTATLTVTTTRGDSVVATFPTANPAIVDTLDGTMTATRLMLRSRPRGSVMMRPDGAAPPAPPGDVSFVMHLRFDLNGDSGIGTRTTELKLPPGMSAEPSTDRMTATRQR